MRDAFRRAVVRFSPPTITTGINKRIAAYRISQLEGK